MIVCPHCSKDNPASRDICIHCNKLLRDEQSYQTQQRALYIILIAFLIGVLIAVISALLTWIDRPTPIPGTKTSVFHVIYGQGNVNDTNALNPLAWSVSKYKHRACGGTTDDYNAKKIFNWHVGKQPESKYTTRIKKPCTPGTTDRICYQHPQDCDTYDFQDDASL